MIAQLFTFFAATGDVCVPKHGSFLGFPTWYKYLEGIESEAAGGVNDCVVRIVRLNDAWLIAAAILELILRIGSVIAIAMVIYGGVMYITSEGEPDKAQKALKTVLGAVIGLAITIAAAAAVSFIAGRF
jgi:hypothetical protein